MDSSRARSRARGEPSCAPGPSKEVGWGGRVRVRVRVRVGGETLACVEGLVPGGAMLAPRKAEIQGCARSASVGAPPARARSRRARRPEQEAWRRPHRESWQWQLLRPCIWGKCTCQGWGWEGCGCWARVGQGRRFRARVKGSSGLSVRVRRATPCWRAADSYRLVLVEHVLRAQLRPPKLASGLRAVLHEQLPKSVVVAGRGHV